MASVTQLKKSAFKKPDKIPYTYDILPGWEVGVRHHVGGGASRPDTIDKTTPIDSTTQCSSEVKCVCEYGGEEE